MHRAYVMVLKDKAGDHELSHDGYEAFCHDNKE